jgi:spermidine synthase
MRLRFFAPTAMLTPAVYLAAFLTGGVVMSFEMLGSRYLSPHFGSGIYTWSALISTVLLALCAGYFLGGAFADRRPSAVVLGAVVALGSAYLLVLPAFAEPVLRFFVWHIDDIKLGSLAAALTLMLLPVTLLGMYSPFAIRLLLRSENRSGTVSGTVYGVSTAGSIFGTLGTTFFLIPSMGSHTATLALGAVGLFAGALLVIGGRPDKRLGKHPGQIAVLAMLVAAGALFGPTASARAGEPFDAETRAAMLARKDGLVAHLETVYNDIFISKSRNLLKMSFQWQSWFFHESEVNLADPDDLPIRYARAITIAAIYPPEIKRVLVLGLGGGSVTTYFARFLPEATIDTVELDPGVIDAAKKYFGLVETERSHLIEGDGRVFLTRHAEPYDLIVVDAFTGSYIPFHLMTKEFYQLVHDRLSPHGVAAFNILPGEKLFDSNVRTLRLVFDNVDFFNSGDRFRYNSNVIVLGRRDAVSSDEAKEKAVAAQARYKFRYDVAQLLAARKIEISATPKGEVLTDDFAPVDVYDAYGRRYRRKN